jgi:hypothetical protein
MVPHQTPLRIERPNGEKYEAAHISARLPISCAERRDYAERHEENALCGLANGSAAYSRRQLFANAAIAASRVAS